MDKRAFHVFSGFPEGRLRTINLPDVVFTELLPYIEDLDELKVTLLALRKLTQVRSDAAPWFTVADLDNDPAVRQALPGDRVAKLEQALVLAVRRGALLQFGFTRADGTVEQRYFANSPRGRVAVQALQRGDNLALETVEQSRPNIFALYEQNIGPMTPMLSEELMEAEKTYPPEWIEEAIREAVERNVRNWRYIHAILEKWNTEGRHEIDQRDRQRDGKTYIQGKYGRFIKH